MSERYNIILNKDITNRANDFLKDIGLSINEAFNIFLEKIIEYKGINFIDDEIPNKETKQALMETEGEIFENFDDFLKFYED